MMDLRVRLCCMVFASGLLLHADQLPKQPPSQPNLSHAVTSATSTSPSNPAGVQTQRAGTAPHAGSNSLTTTISDLAQKHPNVSLGLEIYVCIVLLWLMLLGVAPLTLPAILSTIRSALPKGFKTIALDHATFLPQLARSSRVLNAWVASNINHARATFDGLSIPAASKPYIAAPARVGKETRTVWTAQSDLAPLFARNAAFAIEGEGGAGKTSLACEIGSWSMAKDRKRRLMKRYLLPILFVSDLDTTAYSESALVERIRGYVQELIGMDERIPEGMVEELLRTGRILLIVDGFSERNETTRNAIFAALPRIKQIVFTSRTEVEVMHRPLIRIRPLPIEGKNLWRFMEGFLRREAAQWSFDDVRQACERLSEITRDREITALIAALYGRMIVAEKTQPETRDTPGNIPDLMNMYRDLVTVRIAPDIARREKIKTILAKLARQCVCDGFVPRELPRQDALAIAGGDDEGIKILKSLEESHLIRSASITENVSFALDSLAEYLAAQSIIQEFQGNEAQWQELLNRADELARAGGSLQIRGFLAALNDCCRHGAVRGIVPPAVPDELMRRLGSDLPTQARRLVDRRIGCYAAALESEDIKVRINALTGLSQIGPVARSVIPALIPILSDPDPDVRYAALETLAAIDVTSELAVRAIASLLSDSEERVRNQAAWIMYYHVPNLLLAVGSLIAAVQSGNGDDQYQKLVYQTLGKIGPQAAAAQPALEEILDDKSPGRRPSLRLAAATALWKITQQADQVLPLLQGMLQLDDIRIRDSAGQFVEDLGDSFVELAPALLRLCQDSNAGTRATAARLLCRNAVRVREQVREFEKLLQQETDPVARIWEAAALWRIDIRDEEQVRIIIDILRQSPSSAARALAANILGQMHEPARSSAALLETLRSDTDDEVRRAAVLALKELKVESPLYLETLIELSGAAADPGLKISALEALGAIRPTSPEILGAIAKALEDANASVRQRACLELRHTSAGEPEVVQALMHVCQVDSDKHMRAWAAEGLGRFKEKSSNAVPVLDGLLRDKEISVRVAAAGALWDIASFSNGALRLLTDALLQANEWVRKSALEILAKMGDHATPALPVIIETIKDPNDMVRREALETIAALGPSAAAASSAVIEAIGDKDDLACHAALKALPRVSTPTAEILPKLIACLAATRNSSVRREAAELIGEIGPSAAQAVPELMRLLDDPDRLCRQAAAEALGQMGASAVNAIPQLMEARLHPRRVDEDPLIADLLESLWHDAIDTSIASIARGTNEGVATVRGYLAKVPRTQATIVIGILGKIGTDAAAAAPELIDLAAGQEDSSVGVAVAQALAAMHNRTPETIAVLNSMLNLGNEADVRTAALRAHMELRAANNETILGLRAGLTDSNGLLRLTFAEAFWTLQNDKTVVFPVVEEALRSSESSIRTAAMSLAGKIGPDANELVPIIREFALTADENEQQAAGMALWSIEGTRDVVILLRKQLSSKAELTRITAVSSLATLGPTARDAEPELTTAVRDGVMGSIAALAGIYVDEASKLNFLIAGLDRPVSLRKEAAIALGSMGPSAYRALADLEKATHDPLNSVRKAAAQAIRSIKKPVSLVAD